MGAAFAGLLAAVGVGAALLWIQMVPKNPDELTRSELFEQLDNIKEGLAISRSGLASVNFSPENQAVYDAMPADAAFEISSLGGEVVVNSGSGPALSALRQARKGQEVILVDDGKREVPLEVIDQVFVRQHEPYRVKIARSHRLVTTLQGYAAERYLRALVLTALIALAIFVVVVYSTVSRAVHPISRISHAASEINPQNLASRLEERDLPSEIRPLVVAFNAALDRLERGFRVQQQFLSSAAHELKTPLALLQGEIELMTFAGRDNLLRDTTLMARQVHQLLQLAEVSEGQNYDLRLTAVWPVLCDALGYMERLAVPQNVALVRKKEPDVDLTLRADGAALFVLAKNLLENAVLHSPVGGTVTLSLHVDRFEVNDEGDGIGPEDQSHIFERFWRKRRGESEGAGLGLSICREICAAHGWSIAAHGGRGGRGTCFEVRFYEPAN